MAELTQTAGNVLVDRTQPYEEIDVILGEAAMTAGMSVYKDADDSNRVKKAKAGGTAAQAKCIGVLENGGGIGQPGKVLKKGIINLGATLGLGKDLVVGTTAGAIMPEDDIVSGNYVSRIGQPVSASLCEINPGAPTLMPQQPAASDVA